MSFKIRLETKFASDRPRFLFIKNRKRSACATSVKILDPSTLVCCSLLGRTMYLVKFDRRTCAAHVLSTIETSFEDSGTETDLCDANDAGQIVTSNFYKGSGSLYQRVGDAIVKVSDFPFRVNGFAHGVKFYRSGIVAMTITTGRPGVFFFHTNEDEELLHIPIENVKAQDVCFLSDTKMVVVANHGAPTKQGQNGYRSDVMLFEFCINSRTYTLTKTASYTDCHFDCATAHNSHIFVTDQVNDSVKVFDSIDLYQVDEIKGFSFPHGLDIAFNLMAVTNYGTNDIDIIPLRDRNRVSRALSKLRYRVVHRLRRRFRDLARER